MHHIHPLSNAGKNRVIGVKVQGRRMGNEPLRTLGMIARRCHAHDPLSKIVHGRQFRRNGEIQRAVAVSARATRLRHKIWHNAVKYLSVEKTDARQIDEISD